MAIAMPMTLEAVTAYLGTVLAGCVVVGIADSFAPQQIADRNRISHAQAIVTQDVILRGDKKLPMYARVVAAKSPRAVVIPAVRGQALQVIVCPVQPSLAGKLAQDWQSRCAASGAELHEEECRALACAD